MSTPRQSEDTMSGQDSVQGLEQEPFWHAVVSELAPVINKAIRRADVAKEYASKYREQGYRDVEVVPLYRASPSTGAAEGAKPAVQQSAPQAEQLARVQAHFGLTEAQARSIVEGAHGPAAPQAEVEQAHADAAVYGTGFLVDGKRVDPTTVYLAAPAQSEAKEPYHEGVNVDRLREVMTFLGIAGYGHEETAARMAECINQVTRGVMRLKESIEAKGEADKTLAKVRSIWLDWCDNNIYASAAKVQLDRVFATPTSPTPAEAPAGQGEADYQSTLGPQPGLVPGGYRQELIDWAAEQWHAQVAARPMVNIHRRSLDDVWRQVLRHLGVDDRARLGPTHDELRAQIGSKEWTEMQGKGETS